MASNAKMFPFDDVIMDDRLPMDSPNKGHWRRALMYSMMCAWIYGWVKSPDAGDLRRHVSCNLSVYFPYFCEYITYKIFQELHYGLWPLNNID